MADGRCRSRKVARKEADQEPLLPGLPDELVLMNVAARIPWETSNILQMVSRGWLDAIQSRRVYNERVRTQSRLNYLLALNDDPSRSNTVLTVFSTRGDYSVDLPPIPGIKEDLHMYECTVWDGIVYVWGGRFRPVCEVYMLDLVGARKWKRCHSILSNYLLHQKSKETGNSTDRHSGHHGAPLPAHRPGTVLFPGEGTVLSPDSPDHRTLYVIPKMPDSLVHLYLPPFANWQWRQLGMTDRSKHVLTDAQCAQHFPLIVQPVAVQDPSSSAQCAPQFPLMRQPMVVQDPNSSARCAPLPQCAPQWPLIRQQMLVQNPSSSSGVHDQRMAASHRDSHDSLGDICYPDGLAIQVYYWQSLAIFHEPWNPRLDDDPSSSDFDINRFDMEQMFFIGSELHKLVDSDFEGDDDDTDADDDAPSTCLWVWDPRAFSFKRGRSCRLQLLRAGEIDTFSVLSCTNVGNVIWAIVGLFEMTVGFLEYMLVRSQELSEGVNEEIIWSDSGYALDLCCAPWSFLRPACL